jgi:hypothetical protein
VVIAILGPPRRADLKARVWPILRDARLNPIAILLLGDIQTTLAELYAPQLARLHTLAAFQGRPDSADGIFLFPNAPLPIGYHPPMSTAYGGANADVGQVTRAEQPRTRPIKKAIFYRLGRLLKLNFQLNFSFDVPCRPWKTRQAIWARRCKAH